MRHFDTRPGCYRGVDTWDASLEPPALPGDTLVVRARNVSVLAPHPLAEPDRSRVPPECTPRFRPVQSCRREVYVAPGRRTGRHPPDLVCEAGPFSPVPDGTAWERFELEGGSTEPGAG